MGWLVTLLAALLLWTPDLDRATLEERYLRPPATYVDLDGQRLRVVDEGPRDAAAVVLIHGFASSVETWDAWAPLFARTRRVVRFDLPGTALSGPDPHDRYDDARTVDTIVALLDRLGIARATVVGNSLGGRIAWTFAATRPERVDRLVLISSDGFAIPGFGYADDARDPPKAGLATHAMEIVMPKPLVRGLVSRAYADPAVLDDARLRRYDDLLRAPGARGRWIARMEQSVRRDPVERLAAIRAPTLVLWGTEDRVIPFDNARRFVDAMPSARLAALPGVGHLPQEEAPDASFALVDAFLAER